MKISQTPDPLISLGTGTPSGPAKPGTGAAAPATPSATAPKAAVAAGVAVSVSSLARSLEAAGRSDPSVVDTAKVAAVKAAIQNGTYRVNPEAIADRLLANAQEMLDRRRVRPGALS